MQHLTQKSPTSSGETTTCHHGTVVLKGTGTRKFYRDCQQCCAEYEKQEEEKEEHLRKISLFKDMMWGRSTQIPRRFKDKTLANYKPATEGQAKILKVCEKFVENFDSAHDLGTSIVFCGKPGTGKTHLGYAIIKALREKYIDSYIVSAADMTSEIKYAYKSEDRAVNPGTVTAEYASFSLLVIDEVGVQVDSDSEKRLFFDVINKRYENMLPTILISNLDLQSLTGFVGERVMDRMNENGGVIFAFDWKSAR